MMKNATKVSAALLQTLPLLTVLNQRQLEALTAHVDKKDVPAGVTFLFEGQNPDGLHFVLTGWMKAEKLSPEGRQQTLRFIGPGEVMNELAVFSGLKTAATFITLDDTEILSIPMDTLQENLMQDPEFLKAVIRSLANRTHQLVQMVENLSLHNVEVRLARFLLDEAKDGVIRRPPWKTQQEIAARLGTVLEVTNRSLQKIIKEGLIKMDRDQITILDSEKLKDLAQSKG